ncbi:hypothetical protein N7468_000615 [Penicillium chermesinum]|uniref:Glucose-methanol-choline oxidoreductase N-terminal domain-containing protein n=1 Tax=Penicillium chermesinum TaxID=63820 RepID=A0A9W9PLX8_9EURO|nr:uncharacterized protein N7468_000615 [Penicillium chermesinum]KAJ5249164.1 hypothetical protein N7468_000615 [Penicillium chermesinum]
MATSYDYIVVGGGTAGCVIASKLHEKLPTASILVLEAGEETVGHSATEEPLKAMMAHKSELDWNLSTVPQTSLGDRADYDRWATLVGDARWSYKQLLPYFPKTATRSATERGAFNPAASPSTMYTATPSQSHPERKYPLRGPMLAAWKNNGVKYISDANSGYPMGISERVENFNQGKRQFAHQIYSLKGIKILTRSTVARIKIQKASSSRGDAVATGVELISGLKLTAKKEVIISAGTYNSPKILMLSGIGPAKHLSKHGIDAIVDSPEVGQNFHDHMAEAMNHPIWKLGWASDWTVSAGIDNSVLRKAIVKDDINLLEPFSQLLLNPHLCFTETLNFYTPAGTTVAEMDTPMDGSHISSTILGLSPISRGTISLASRDPLAQPIIDPNYYSTEVDRVAMRIAIRKAIQVYTSEPLTSFIEGESPPAGFPPLTRFSLDREIDERVRRVGISFSHPAGSCAMGMVVDSECRVYGVKNLRVADASVLPTPIAAHLQQAVYAIGARVVDFMVARI